MIYQSAQDSPNNRNRRLVLQRGVAFASPNLLKESRADLSTTPLEADLHNTGVVRLDRDALYT